MALAADPLAVKKGGKKGRKAMLRAARIDPSIEIPNRIVDLVSLEQQIRRFLADISSRDNMVLPPCNKNMRKKIHELANAFNLKSQSKGKGDGRYTTLIKTSRSGIGINERKVKRILKSENPYWEGPDIEGKGRIKGRAISLAKHREGEEVGKVRSSRTSFHSLTHLCTNRLHRRLASPILGTSYSHLWAGMKEIELVCLEGWMLR